MTENTDNTDNTDNNSTIKQPQPEPHAQSNLLPFHKTKEERVADIKPIIHRLNEFNLNINK